MPADRPSEDSPNIYKYEASTHITQSSESDKLPSPAPAHSLQILIDESLQIITSELSASRYKSPDLTTYTAIINMKFLSITCAIGLLVLSAFTNALPSPAALPASILEGKLEIVARDADAGANEALLVGSGSKAKAKLAAREPTYCWKGWNKINFQGDWVEICSWVSCYSWDNDLASNRLFSAKATASTTGGVYLWTKKSCTGEKIWVDFEGWGNLSKAAALYSMSLV